MQKHHTRNGSRDSPSTFIASLTEDKQRSLGIVFSQIAKRYVRRILQGSYDEERGQVLPTVLVVLMIGSVAITPVLGQATTSLQTNRLMEDKMRSIYAAEAGIEQVIWSLQQHQQFPSQLTGGLNNLSVNLTMVEQGMHTVYLGELIPARQHYAYTGISGDFVWDDTVQKYKYTATVTWQAGSTTIHIDSIGARLPDGYTYEVGSAASFAGNLDISEPAILLDSNGHQMVNWEFDEPLPQVKENDPVRTQSFYIVGTGVPTGDYAFAVANRDDVGQIGELTGIMYQIIAKAIEPDTSRVSAIIVVDAIQIADDLKIVNWVITN